VIDFLCVLSMSYCVLLVLKVVCLKEILKVKCISGIRCGFLTGIALLGSTFSESQEKESVSLI